MVITTDFSRVVFAQSSSSAPTLAYSHWPEICPLYRPMWNLEVGAGREESWNQDLENLVLGIFREHSTGAVWMWLSLLLPLVTRWPFSQEETLREAAVTHANPTT